LANNGHELIRGEAMRQQFVHEQLKEFAGSRHYFLNEDGSSGNAGDWVVQKDLGRVLQAIADEGPEVFYSGWIAEKIIEDNQANGGVLTLESLKNYKAEDSHIVTGSYRGYGLRGLWMPAYGAITIEALQVLETISDDYSDNQKWGEAVYHAIEAAYLDRKKQHTLEDADRLTSIEWAQKRASEIHNDTAVCHKNQEESIRNRLIRLATLMMVLLLQHIPWPPRQESKCWQREEMP
jgi:gamma-glutamyltranspeptidase